MKKIWDISPLITPHFPLWPGSQPLARTIDCDMNLGEVVTSSSMNATVHLGAHADAPSHYAKTGRTIDENPLHYYLGTCQVIHSDIKKGLAITQASIKLPILSPRLLFATLTFDYTKRLCRF